MIKYKVAQDQLGVPIMRSGKYIVVYDKKGNEYMVRLDLNGELEVSTIGDDLKVVCKTSNTLKLSVEDGKH